MATSQQKLEALALEQGSQEWLDYKVGKVSASRIADITAKLRNGVAGASRATYLGELIAERLTGISYGSYSTPAMQWGTEHEPMARAAYQFRALMPVTRVGCILHPDIDNALCSPDGLIGSDGMVEFKCPNTSTHCDFLLGAEIPGRYLQQMQWQLACAQRQWVDYVSFDPRLPEHLQLWVQRVPRDDRLIVALQVEVMGFLHDLELRLQALAKIQGDIRDRNSRS